MSFDIHDSVFRSMTSIERRSYATLTIARALTPGKGNSNGQRDRGPVITEHQPLRSTRRMTQENKDSSIVSTAPFSRPRDPLFEDSWYPRAGRARGICHAKLNDRDASGRTLV